MAVDGSGLSGATACVLGLGRSGLAAVRLLLEQGRPVVALERNVTPAIAVAFEPLAARGARLIAGPHPENALDGCDLLVRSPGVPPAAPILGDARRRGIPICSELALAARGAQSPILAITGTNGKSTTTAWTAHLLRRAGIDAVAAGNIGYPLAAAVLEHVAGAVFVAEVSSFQLEDSADFHPRGAAILNITPDHLDRHGSLDAYAAAKWALTANQAAGDLLVLGPGLEAPRGSRPRARILRLAADGTLDGEGYCVRGGAIWRHVGGRGSRLAMVGDLALPGPHNLINGMAALALAGHLVDDSRRLLQGLRDFPGLPHRLEEVGCWDGVRMINDSKSTNVASLRVALQSFPGGVVLIAGGRDKEGAFADLADLARGQVRHLVAIGEAAGKVIRAWPEVAAETADSLEAAVDRAHQAAPPGGVVLLSPGCASFDMFRDYEHRGDAFRTIVTARIAAATGGDPH